jgi:hypothetical protein
MSASYWDLATSGRKMANVFRAAYLGAPRYVQTSDVIPGAGTTVSLSLAATDPEVMYAIGVRFRGVVPESVGEDRLTLAITARNVSAIETSPSDNIAQTLVIDPDGKCSGGPIEFHGIAFFAMPVMGRYLPVLGVMRTAGGTVTGSASTIGIAITGGVAAESFSAEALAPGQPDFDDLLDAVEAWPKYNLLDPSGLLDELVLDRCCQCGPDYFQKGSKVKFHSRAAQHENIEPRDTAAHPISTSPAVANAAAARGIIPTLRNVIG